jgi:hypothetical protein
MRDEFGASYAASLASDLVVGALDGRTADAALAAGVPPQQVWRAVCDAAGVPPERRLGRDRPTRRGPGVSLPD